MHSHSFWFYWPQAIVVFMLLLALFRQLEKGREADSAKLLAVFLWFFLLWMGGFFENR